MYKKSLIFIGVCALVCFGAALSGALNPVGTQIAIGLGAFDGILLLIGMRIKKTS